MALFDGVSAMFSGGNPSEGMGAMLEHLAANGLAEHVEAWTNGNNVPVSADQLKAALGSDQAQQMASAAGQPVEDFLRDLSGHLSNNGATPPSNNT